MMSVIMNCGKAWIEAKPSDPIWACPVLITIPDFFLSGAVVMQWVDHVHFNGPSEEPKIKWWLN